MAGQYKTRCPHCGAQFKISDEHLGQARGAVRCGSCLQIFQATDHLINGEAGPAAGNRWDRALDDDARAPAASDRDGDRYGDDPTGDAPDDRRAGGGLGESRFSDSFLSLDGDGADDGLGEDFSDMSGAGRGSHRESADEAWAEALLQDLEDEAEPVSTPPRDTRKAPAPPPPEDDDDQLDFLRATPSSREIANERLDHAARRHGPGPLKDVLLWGGLSLLALAILAGQFAFFQFDSLSRSPRWRPLYAQACQYLGCQLPLRSDINTLRGANLVVRSDPDYQNALMVDALLYNEGDWPQPFPVLELTFNDLKGKVVARRRFRPDEYLHGQAADMRTMPVNTPIHVSLQIVDPGDRAVSYNLRLLPAGSAAPRVGRAP